MRILGRAVGDSGIIIQLNHAEARSLQALQDALDGNEWRNIFGGGPEVPDDREMDKAFEAVRYFIKANFAINGLARAVDELRLIVNGESDANES